MNKILFHERQWAKSGEDISIIGYRSTGSEEPREGECGRHDHSGRISLVLTRSEIVRQLGNRLWPNTLRDQTKRACMSDTTTFKVIDFEIVWVRNRVPWIRMWGIGEWHWRIRQVRPTAQTIGCEEERRCPQFRNPNLWSPRDWQGQVEPTLVRANPWSWSRAVN